MWQLKTLHIFLIYYVMVYCDSAEHDQKNVLGTKLEVCSMDPLTGYMRDGYCTHTERDGARHAVCAKVTEKFLTFTKSQGNDLSTPNEYYRFPGLKPGDRWCLCAVRWREAERNNVAPEVVLSATNEVALDYNSLELLSKYKA